MQTVTIYSTATCPYCVRAKQLLDKKGVEYTEIRVDEDPKQREIMMEKSKRQSVPQIFINNQPIGGCDELYALHKTGELDNLLK